MNRPKIVMLITQLGYGGAETSFIRLANFLAQSMDVTVALFTPHYGAGAYAQGHAPLNVPVVLLDSPAVSGRIARWWRRIRTMQALKKKHDVCISFLSGPNMVNALSGAQHRTVISLRGSRFYDPVAPTWQRLLFQYLLDPIAYHLAAQIVPVSAGLQNEMQHVAGKNIVSKVRVIPPFVEEDALQRRLAEAPPERYAPLKGQKVIVAVGRLSIEKGFQHLIRVFHRVAASHTGAKLLLVGDGPMLPELRALCDTLGLPMDELNPHVSSVLFALYQENALPLMALGRVYAMTSATEGFPSTVLEAMAAGVPVVAADTPWGVRAILCANPTPTHEPYPTATATMVDYGMLMPRIDMAEHDGEWAHALGSYLESPPVPDAGVAQRVQDYDIRRIGVQWQQLIQSMMECA